MTTTFTLSQRIMSLKQMIRDTQDPDERKQLIEKHRRLELEYWNSRR